MPSRCRLRGHEGDDMSKNVRKIITFFFLALTIGITFIAVARNTSGLYLFVSAKSLQDYVVSIDAEKENIKKIRLLTAESTQKLEQYKESMEDPQNRVLEETLEKELEVAMMASGALDMKGAGIVAKLDDGVRPLYNGEDPNNVLVHDLDILNLINDLKEAGAEAISINGQRITNTTEVSCAGYTVKVNNIFIARPFTIKAIGDPKMLKAALLAPMQWGDVLLAWGLIFEVEEFDEVEIRGYTGQNYTYMQMMKEGDIQ